MTDDSMDREIREAVEPTAATVDRVLTAALRPASGRRLGPGVWLATATALLVMVGLMASVRYVSHPVAAGDVRVTNVGDTIVVERPEGTVWLIGRGTEEPDRLADGTIIAYTPGGRR